MASEKESYWAAKAPLWVIASSLLTIACCLVLLVMRTVVRNERSQSSATTTEAQPGSAKWERRLSVDSRPREEFFVSQENSSKVISGAEQTNRSMAAIDPTLTEQPPRAVLAVNSRPMRPMPTVLFSVQYENSIKGTVRLKGEAPQETAFDSGDVPCAEPGQRPRNTRFFMTDDKGGLADTLVYIVDGLSTQVFPTPEGKLELVFTNCLIEPYVSAVMLREHLTARDETGLAHRLRFKLSNSNSSEPALPPSGAADLPTNTGTDLFARLSCDVHPWEFAYVSILKHPFFAVTDEHGEFVITNVPPGKYTLEARHRSGSARDFGMSQKTIRVTPKDVTTVDFDILSHPH